MINLKKTPADTLFSLRIRHRDGGRCQLCLVYFGVEHVDCSHHFGRGHKSTRWDPLNCMAACRECHKWLAANPLAYVDFMIRRMGSEAYWAMKIRAYSAARYVDQAAIAEENRRILAGMGVFPGRRAPALSTFVPGPLA